MKQVRKIIVDEDAGVAFVPLTRGHTAVIDASDAELIGRWNWSSDICKSRRTPYAKRTEGTRNDARCVFLHRFLWEAWGNDPAPQMDHIDGDGLNNRRSNLRAATIQQNAANRVYRSASGRKGVSFRRDTGRWIARIGANGFDRHLGTFDTADEAAAAYARAAQEHYGEFARVA